MKNFFFLSLESIYESSQRIPKGTKCKKEKFREEAKRQIDEMFSTLIEIYIALENAFRVLRGGNSKLQF